MPTRRPAPPARRQRTPASMKSSMSPSKTGVGADFVTGADPDHLIRLQDVGTASGRPNSPDVTASSFLAAASSALRCNNRRDCSTVGPRRGSGSGTSRPASRRRCRSGCGSSGQPSRSCRHLSTRATGAEDVDLDLVLGDLDGSVLDDRDDLDRGEARLPPPLIVEGTDPHQAMSATFDREVAMGIRRRSRRSCSSARLLRRRTCPGTSRGAVPLGQRA